MPYPHKQIALTLGFAALAGGLVLGGCHADAASPAGAQGVDSSPSVTVAPVRSEMLRRSAYYAGRLEAVDVVTVRPRVPGTITAVHFKDGDLVAKGAPLFTIDPAPYEAALAQARANFAAAQAEALNARTEFERAQRLLAGDALSKTDFDARRNRDARAKAGVSAAEAAVQVAALNLGYTRITAPVAGRVSRAEVTLGNVVSAGGDAAPLTTLVSQSPIYASFEVDEASFLRFFASADTTNLPVSFGLASDADYPRHGSVVSVDNRLDSTSGTVRVRALFDNPNGRLIPGLQARIKLESAAPQPALLVDDSAIGTDQDKRYVLVVGEDRKVAYHAVTLGDLHDGKRIVLDGVHAGDLVITDGLQSAHPGELVRAVQATAAAAPDRGTNAVASSATTP